MGDRYDIKDLLGVFYLEYQTAQTDWQPKAIKLNREQFHKIAQHEAEMERLRAAFFESLIGESE